MPSLNTGNAILSNPIKVDSSYNVGIGGAASGSFKLQVTGTTNLTGALSGTSAGLSSTLSAMGTNIQFNLDGTFGANYYTMGFGGVSNGFNRISGGTGTTDGLYITSATGRDIVFRTNGSASNTLVLLSTGAATFSSSVTAQTGEFISGGQDGATGSVVRISTTSANANARNWGIVNTWDNFGDLTFRVSNAQGGNPLSAGATRMVILSNGNVGIGTSSPSTLLHLNATTTQLTLQNTDGGANAERVGMFMTGGDTFKLISLNDNNTTRVDNILVANVLNGNIGIGTSSPSAKLEISGTNSQVTSAIYQTIASTDSSAGLLIQASSTSHYPFIRFNQGSSGKLELGVTGSGDSFGGGNFYLNFNTATGSTGAALRITSGGKVGIGTSSVNNEMLTINQTSGNSSALLVNTSVASGQSYGLTIQAGTNSSDRSFAVFNQAGSSEYFRVRGDGYMYSIPTYNNGAGLSANVGVAGDGSFYRATSSLKYKRNVNNYTKGLAEVMQLRAVTYQGINELDGDNVYAGLIAEEVHELGLTEFVQYAEDGTPDALAYQNMIALAFKAIQEQQAQIEAQQQQINSLINR